MHIVAHQCAAQSDCMGCQMAAAIKTCGKRSDVERIAALSLQAIMMRGCIGPADQFRHRIGEIHAAVHAHITLYDTQLAPCTEHDERARMRHDRSVVRVGRVDEINRLGPTAALRHHDNGALRHERRVERYESIAPVIRVPAQLRQRTGL